MQIFEAFAKAGGNFVDTANYLLCPQRERAHRGELIAAERERWVVTNRVHLQPQPRRPQRRRQPPQEPVQSLDVSLERLRTDYIDVQWVHIWNAFTPVN